MAQNKVKNWVLAMTVATFLLTSCSETHNHYYDNGKKKECPDSKPRQKADPVIIVGDNNKGDIRVDIRQDIVDVDVNGDNNTIGLSVEEQNRREFDNARREHDNKYGKGNGNGGRKPATPCNTTVINNTVIYVQQPSKADTLKQAAQNVPPVAGGNVRMDDVIINAGLDRQRSN